MHSHFKLALGARTRRWSNTSPLHVVSQTLLHKHGWVGIPTDKEGGFCLVPLSVFKAVHSEILSSHWYRPVSSIYTSSSYWEDSVIPPYLRICARVARATDIPVSQLLVTVSSRHTTSILRNTVKTHKDPGKVSFRAIHASPRHCFGAGSAWLQRVCDSQLKLQFVWL